MLKVYEHIGLNLKLNKYNTAGSKHKSGCPCFMLVSFSAYFWTLKMEEICSSEMSVDFQANTMRYVP
jgi:hypothetical protein